MFFNNHKTCYEIINVFHVNPRAGGVLEVRDRNFNGLGYRISGNSYFNSQGKTYFADTGTFCFIPKKFDFRRTSTDEELVIIHLHSYGESEKEIQIFAPDNISKFAGYFFEIHKVWEESAPGYRNKCHSIFYKMLEEMELYHASNFLGKKESIIQDSLVYMNMNFDNPQLSIAEIASKSNISEVYFRKIYKELFDTSPSKAIQNMRLTRAKELLETGYFSIMEVSQKSGFDNVKYFSTLFNKVVGIPPSEYMKRYFSGRFSP